MSHPASRQPNTPQSALETFHLSTRPIQTWHRSLTGHLFVLLHAEHLPAFPTPSTRSTSYRTITTMHQSNQPLPVPLSVAGMATTQVRSYIESCRFRQTSCIDFVASALACSLDARPPPPKKRSPSSSIPSQDPMIVDSAAQPAAAAATGQPKSFVARFILWLSPIVPTDRLSVPQIQDPRSSRYFFQERSHRWSVLPQSFDSVILILLTLLL